MRWLLPLFVIVVMCMVLPARAVARGWERPVDGPVLRAFALAGDRFAAGQHRGVDLAAPPGAQVRAACGGRVSFAGRVPRGGLTVSIRCGRLVATYQHLAAAAVRRAQVVSPGARVGTVGSARPHPHVHLGARDRVTGEYLDPLSLLAGAPRALPPPLPIARRPLPLGPAPRARRPVRAGPLREGPASRSFPVFGEAPVTAGRGTGSGHLPWPVWLGLALLGLGLPVGGLVRTRERRRRTAVVVTQAPA